MKTITYKCNMCQSITNPIELTCFYFKCDIIPQQNVLTKDLTKSDNHICKTCIAVIDKEQTRLKILS